MASILFIRTNKHLLIFNTTKMRNNFIKTLTTNILLLPFLLGSCDTKRDNFDRDNTRSTDIEDNFNDTIISGEDDGWEKSGSHPPNNTGTHENPVMGDSL